MVRLADDHGRSMRCAPKRLNRLASGWERLKNGHGLHRPRPESDETIPSHTNIRGGDYYRSDKGGATP